MSRLITEADVRSAAATGRSIDVESGVIVTPAARDLASKMGVALRKEEPGSGGRSPSPNPVRVAVGSDHGGFEMKEFLKDTIGKLGFVIDDVGCESNESVDYPVFAARVAERIADGTARFGVMVDGAGIGSSMVGNKIAGVRAALCYDVTTAGNAREHNDANMLTLGGTLVGKHLAAEIVRTFLSTEFAGGRHQRRVSMIDALDQERTTS